MQFTPSSLVSSPAPSLRWIVIWLLLASVWFTLAWLIRPETFGSLEPFQILVWLVGVAVALRLFLGEVFIVAMAARFTIFVSAIMLIVHWIEAGIVLTRLIDQILVVAIITGILLERSIPLQHLPVWMFLGVSSKIQAILVTGLISFAHDVGVTSTFPIWSWWVTVGLMLVAVLAAALQLRRSYCAVVMITAFTTLFLLLDILRQPDLSTAFILIVGAAATWPLFADRMVGKRVFVVTRLAT